MATHFNGFCFYFCHQLSKSGVQWNMVVLPPDITTSLSAFDDFDDVAGKQNMHALEVSRYWIDFLRGWHRRPISTRAPHPSYKMI